MVHFWILCLFYQTSRQMAAQKNRNIFVHKAQNGFRMLDKRYVTALYSATSTMPPSRMVTVMPVCT